MKIFYHRKRLFPLALFISLFLIGACSTNKEDSETIHLTQAIAAEDATEADMMGWTNGEFDEVDGAAIGYSSDSRNYNYSSTGNTPVTHREPAPTVKPPKGSKIIKTGSMQFEVEHIQKAKAELNYLVNKYEAYFANEEYDDQNHQIVFQLSVRIPTESYERFLQELEQKNLGILKDKQIQSKDVGEEYHDMETRLKNQLRYIDRYGELLKQAKKMSDIIEIQEKIRVLEEQIDRVKGRLRYLNDRIAYGTLNLMIYQPIEDEVVLVEEDTFWSRLGDSFMNGWGAILDFIIFISNLWPFLLILGLAFWWGYRKYIKKKAA